MGQDTHIQVQCNMMKGPSDHKTCILLQGLHPVTTRVASCYKPSMQPPQDAARTTSMVAPMMLSCSDHFTCTQPIPTTRCCLTGIGSTVKIMIWTQTMIQLTSRVQCDFNLSSISPGGTQSEVNLRSMGPLKSTVRCLCRLNSEVSD
jgi:hypothetical protein